MGEEEAKRRAVTQGATGAGARDDLAEPTSALEARRYTERVIWD